MRLNNSLLVLLPLACLAAQSPEIRKTHDGFRCPICQGKGGYKEYDLSKYEAHEPCWSTCCACNGSGWWKSSGRNKSALEYSLWISGWNRIPCLVFVGQPRNYFLEKAVDRKYGKHSAWPISVEVSEFEGNTTQRLVVLVPVFDPKAEWKPAKENRRYVIKGVARPQDIER